MESVANRMRGLLLAGLLLTAAFGGCQPQAGAETGANVPAAVV